MAVAVVVRPTRTLQFLGVYVGVPLLLGWFAYVFASGLPAVTPGHFSMPTNETYEPSMDDFAVFYSAGTIVREGRADLYELPSIRSEEAHTTGSDDAHLLTLPFYSPPFAALPFAAIAAFSPDTAAVLWTVAGMIAFALVCVAAWRATTTPMSRGLAFAAGVIASPPFFQVLIHGQTTFFLLAGALLLWRCAFAGHNAAGAALGLLLLADKPQLLPLPIAFMLLGGQWRPVAGAAALAACATGMVVLLTGTSVVTGYVHLSFQAMSWDDKNGISTWGMFGWNAFARGLLGSGTLPRMALTLILDALTAAAVIVGCRSSATRPVARFALVIFGALLISPHVYEHDVLLAALPVFLLCATMPESRQTWAAFALLGWFTVFFHFDMLNATGINFTALWLALGIVGVLLSMRESVVRRPAVLSTGNLRPAAAS